ncbi:GNAT family N-acetyltransferase [Pseudoalteromonas sp. L21]|uniref:GNAT family N-acetyltransferase n=1 Tax=Pseudoalteromonas sp. L21 TaxID=1539746 RepID=UPI001F1E3B41|nr:GNAT family N-acetyltransferase [Pseudoalteromonas sp. L21]MCF7517926.1 GNAT family N-acetyltransferase [Pseudoalteromonas sp. L21]
MERIISSDITLKKLEVTDASALLNAVELSRVNLSKYMPWEKTVVDLDGAHSYIESRLNSGIEGSEWFAVCFKSQFSGVFGVKSIERESKVCELGYWLADNARGKRVIGQILDIVVPSLSYEQGVKIIEFHCLESNSASLKVVKRAGATLNRRVRNTLNVPNKEQIMCVYTLEV